MLLLVVILGGCGLFGPIVSSQPPPINGRVVDAGTGEPVVGAEVFATYEVGWPAREGELGPRIISVSRWTTTDREGRFAFPPRVGDARSPVDPERVALARSLDLVDPRYGFTTIYAPRGYGEWTKLDLRVEPDPESLEAVEKRTDSQRVCRLDYLPAVAHCCDVLYGVDEEMCIRLDETIEEVREMLEQ